MQWCFSHLWDTPPWADIVVDRFSSTADSLLQDEAHSWRHDCKDHRWHDHSVINPANQDSLLVTHLVSCLHLLTACSYAGIPQVGGNPPQDTKTLEISFASVGTSWSTRFTGWSSKVSQGQCSTLVAAPMHPVDCAACLSRSVASWAKAKDPNVFESDQNQHVLEFSEYRHIKLVGGLNPSEKY